MAALQRLSSLISPRMLEGTTRPKGEASPGYVKASMTGSAVCMEK